MKVNIIRIAFCYLVAAVVFGDIALASEESASIIHSQQEELIRECLKYHHKKFAQQREINTKYSNLHLSKNIINNIIKIPAICFYLLEALETKPNRPLQYVNWMYSDKEFQHETKLPQARTDDDFFFLNPQLGLTKIDKVESQELEQLHEKEKILLNSDRFKEIINSNRKKFSRYLSPVVLIPGLAGSRMQARVDKEKRVNFLCDKQSDWKDIWLSVNQLLPFVMNCWLDNVRLVIDPKTGQTDNAPGVDIRVPDFGKVESVEFLDASIRDRSAYFASIIERYEALGYERNANLLAAPYDFRLAPNELGEWFDALRGLIEEAKYKFSKPITLVCHSMGCLHALVFLRAQTVEWRASNIRKLISLAAPWGGAIKAAKALVAGDTFDLPLVSEAKFRKVLRTFPSVSYLLPNAAVFNATNYRRALPGGPMIVERPSKKYFIKDIGNLLREVNLTQQALWYEQLQELVRPLEPLQDLQVDCVHSSNIRTIEKVFYRSDEDFPDGDYKTIDGDGDGTVNSESLLVCERWKSLLPEKVSHVIIPNTNHIGTLSHEATLTHITDDVLT